MRKTMSKLIAMLVSVTMIFSIGAVAFAEDDVLDEVIEDVVEEEVVIEEVEEEIVEIEEIIEELPQDVADDPEIIEDLEKIEKDVEEIIEEIEETEIILDAIIDDEETPLGFLMGAEEVPEEAIERKVEISSSGNSFVEGDTVVLTAVLTGYEGVEPAVTWQYSVDGENWIDAEGANHDMTYAFTADENTANYFWSVLVSL